MPASRRRSPSSTVATARRSTPAATQRARHGHVAVTVGVGLDDADDLGAGRAAHAARPGCERMATWSISTQARCGLPRQPSSDAAPRGAGRSPRAGGRRVARHHPGAADPLRRPAGRPRRGPPRRRPRRPSAWRPPARKAPIDPGQHVAAAGRGQGGRRDVRAQHARRPGSATTVSRALEHDDLVPALRGLGAAAAARPSSSSASGAASPGEARELAGMRASGPAARAGPATSAACSASAFRPSASTTAGTRSDAMQLRARRAVAGWRPRPGPDDDRVVRRRLGRSTRRQPPGAMSPGASSSSAIQVSSGIADRQPGRDRLGRRDADEPGAGAHRPEAGEQRGARDTRSSRRRPARGRSRPCARARGAAGRLRATQRWVIDRAAAAIGSSAVAAVGDRHRHGHAAARARSRRSPRRGPAPRRGARPGRGGRPAGRRRGSAGSRSRASRRRARRARGPC